MPMFDRQTRENRSAGKVSDPRIREWLDDDGRFRFGKHEGEALADVVEDDPNYLGWIVESAEAISEDERETAQGALEFAERRGNGRGHRRRR